MAQQLSRMGCPRRDLRLGRRRPARHRRLARRTGDGTKARRPRPGRADGLRGRLSRSGLPRRSGSSPTTPASPSRRRPPRPRPRTTSGSSTSTSGASSTELAPSCRSCSSRTRARSSIPRASSACSVGRPSRPTAPRSSPSAATPSRCATSCGSTGVSAVSVHPGGIATNIVNNARFYVDDRGNNDHEVLKSDFDRVARTSPEKAARKIIDGVQRGRQRILVGPDAYAIAGLVRAMPVRYFDLVKRIEPLIRR